MGRRTKRVYCLHLPMISHDPDHEIRRPALACSCSDGLGLEDNQWHYSEILEYVQKIPREQASARARGREQARRMAGDPRWHAIFGKTTSYLSTDIPFETLLYTLI